VSGISGPGVRIDRLVTSGTFSLDGGTWDVDNNVWIVGNDDECLVIDPAHDAAAIAAAVAGRKVTAILLSHGHDDHIAAVGEFRGLVDAPVYLHRDDWMLWERVFPGTEPDSGIDDGDTFDVAGARLVALSTPGHSPGSVSFFLESEGTVFTGDTLFRGGPGATGRSFSDFPTIIESIKARLLTLPADTVVRTGHGDSTTVGDEAPHLAEWIGRGH
jgi:glyoxylase-like metal-dependent hydrolase (beta-lactamase superfamily II)